MRERLFGPDNIVGEVDRMKTTLYPERDQPQGGQGETRRK